MKKLLICIGIIVFFCKVGYSAGTVTVTSPNGGENWKIGSTHNITWNSNAVSGTVAIQLFRAGTLQGVIHPASTLPLSPGTYLWNIPTHLPNGSVITPASNYRIRVYLGPAVFDWSNTMFTISSVRLTSSGLPRKLQPRKMGTAKQRVQVKPKLKSQNLYPDLYVKNIKILTTNPSVLSQLYCKVDIANKGAKASNPCVLELEIKNDFFLSEKRQENLTALAPGSQISKNFIYSPLAPSSAPQNKTGGWYTNIARIDPGKTSGENWIAQRNNTKMLKYFVKEKSRIAGCLTRFYLYTVDVSCMAVGRGTMPASYVSLKVTCQKANFSKTFTKTTPELKPGSRFTAQFDISEIKNMVELYAEEPNSFVQFYVNLDPQNLSYEKPVDEQIATQRACYAIETTPPGGIFFNLCTKYYKRTQ